jgi:uncharacterized protein (TIGR03067 family)
MLFSGKLTVPPAVLLVGTVLAIGVGLMRWSTCGTGQAMAASGDEESQKTDKEKIQGSWVAIAGVRRGETLSEDRIRQEKLSLSFAGDTLIQKSAKASEKKVTFRIDSKKKPKAIDLIDEQGRIYPGIYELNGDTLKLCSAPPGQSRPKEFSGKDTHMQVTLKKQK